MKQTFSPERICPELPFIVKIACGDTFTLCETEEGDFWAFGNFGQSSSVRQSPPTKVPIKPNQYKDFKAGNSHVALLDHDGNVWLLSSYWEESEDPLSKLPIPPVTRISMGPKHLLATSDEGECLVWNLTNGTEELRHFHRQIVHVAAGKMIMCASSDEIYFLSGKHKQMMMNLVQNVSFQKSARSAAPSHS